VSLGPKKPFSHLDHFNLAYLLMGGASQTSQRLEAVRSLLAMRLRLRWGWRYTSLVLGISLALGIGSRG
jgi:hypothetical protein